MGRCIVIIHVWTITRSLISTNNQIITNIQIRMAIGCLVIEI